jgi:hypothetical protein
MWTFIVTVNCLTAPEDQKSTQGIHDHDKAKLD